MKTDVNFTKPLEGTGIHIRDEYAPEDIAMMQSLYSRSPKSVLDHEKKVKEVGSGKFMDKFYVQYGHKSIGDCGTTTIFIEGVSMLAAKILQDWPLYNGQEASTRYLDWANQSVVDPFNSDISKKIISKMMNFYSWAQPLMVTHLKNEYPRKEGENETQYNKAINARSFDILRGFLPTGARTNLSWHTNLRQAGDKLQEMRFHPLPEARELAENLLEKLKVKYPGSFNFRKYPEGDTYRKEVAIRNAFFEPDYKFEENLYLRTDISNSDLKPFLWEIKNRPKYENLPRQINELGVLQWEFFMDFGSFRDIQRHRNGVCWIPRITTKHGFEKWYLDHLSSEVRKEAEVFLREIEIILRQLPESDEVQYYVPMGYRLACRNTYGLMPSVYITELRSGKTVHPTVRTVAHGMHNLLKARFPSLILHSDLTADAFSYKRGGQDIVEK